MDTNIDNIYYFPYAPSFDDLIKGKSKYGVGFYVKDDIEKPKNLRKKLDYFWGERGVKLIYYEHPLAPGIKAKLLLDMSRSKYSIFVNKWYYRLSKYRFENVWPPGQHFTNLVVLKLLENNYMTLHCGSFFNKKTKKGYLIFGASNTGKSYTTFKALEDSYGYHSEDLTIVDYKNIYTTPLISTQSSVLPNKNFALKYNLFVHKPTGINMLIPKLNNLDAFHKFFKNQDVKAKSKLEKIFILEKGDKKIRALTNPQAERKIRILNRLELNYYRDHVLRTYSYFNKSLSIEHIMESEKRLLTDIINNSECFLVSSNSPDDYLTLMRKVIE